MCEPAQQPSAPAGAPSATAPQSVGDALDMVMTGFGWLADADLTSVPASVRAECLRQLERTRSVQTAAHATVLSAFDRDADFTDDGQGTCRTWLRWQTQITAGAASGSVGWMRRLRAHPAVKAALRAGTISESWARQICEWSDLLPESARGDADAILLAAAGGAELADLAALVEQMRAKLAGPDQGKDDGFDDRRLRLATTIGGAGKLDGDLTPGCATALEAVLDALGKQAGPEDLRTLRQRRHDALEEACRRLIGSGCVPDRAGQPTQIQLHISLEELTRRLAGTPAAEHSGTPDWAGIENRLWPRLTPDGSPLPPEPVPWPAAAPGTECDATIVPVVTGRVDHDLLDKLTAQIATGLDRDKVKDLILANAVAVLSGPGALASFLRTGTLPRPAASVSLPLDVGTATDTIPPYLRRAVMLRDKHCAAPGCFAPPSACQVHHLRPRSKGGATKLTGLILMCSFHHLIMVHTWGWTIKLNADGMTTMTNPNRTKVYHSHSPPPASAV